MRKHHHITPTHTHHHQCSFKIFHCVNADFVFVSYRISRPYRIFSSSIYWAPLYLLHIVHSLAPICLSSTKRPTDRPTDQPTDRTPPSSITPPPPPTRSFYLFFRDGFLSPHTRRNRLPAGAYDLEASRRLSPGAVVVFFVVVVVLVFCVIPLPLRIFLASNHDVGCSSSSITDNNCPTRRASRHVEEVRYCGGSRPGWIG